MPHISVTPGQRLTTTVLLGDWLKLHVGSGTTRTEPQQRSDETGDVIFCNVPEGALGYLTEHNIRWKPAPEDKSAHDIDLTRTETSMAEPTDRRASDRSTVKLGPPKKSSRPRNARRGRGSGRGGR